MNIQKMMKQAQQMQAKMATLQEELAAMEVEGTTAGGAVKVTLSGKHDMKAISISEDLIDPEDKEMLEAAVMAAFNDAKQKADTLNADAMSDATGGMKLPF
ncbi:MAG: YbaB/EbfC family nucleoid-associated protein [Rickettsiales bacterium]|nr:YbaB/EbfC family nucleoid-associated protein [Rickettsiales bacterium]